MKNINKNIIEISLPKLDKDTKLNPDFVTGLTEAEGSFSITKHKDIIIKNKVNIGLRFKLTMLNNEIELLQGLKLFFNCGFIGVNKDGSVDFLVRDIKSLNDIIIPHFVNYPLRGTKYLDFIDFKDAIDLINNKDHLTKIGIDKLIKISTGMNSKRRHNKLYSPSHAIKSNINYIPLNGHFVNGFIAGDGCLSLCTTDTNFARMSLQISQHKNNKLLLLSIANYFKSPNKVYYHDTDSIQLTLSGIKLWNNILFHHFSIYPLYGTKIIRLNKFFLIRELMLGNNHLRQVGRYRHWKPDIKLQIINIWNN